jgi:hypothetical protein
LEAADLTSIKPAQKNWAASNKLKAAQPFDPEKPPKRFRGTIFGNNACTRKLLPIYIPDNWLAVSSVPVGT